MGLFLYKLYRILAFFVDPDCDRSMLSMDPDLDPKLEQMIDLAAQKLFDSVVDVTMVIKCRRCLSDGKEGRGLERPFKSILKSKQYSLSGSLQVATSFIWRVNIFQELD